MGAVFEGATRLLAVFGCFAALLGGWERHNYKFGFQRGRKIAHYTLTEDKTILQASGRCLARNA
jgi:hypothetical protein